MRPAWPGSSIIILLQAPLFSPTGFAAAKHGRTDYACPQRRFSILCCRIRRAAARILLRPSVASRPCIFPLLGADRIPVARCGRTRHRIATDGKHHTRLLREGAPCIKMLTRSGFSHIGTLPETGFKFGRWLGDAIFQLILR